MQRILFPTVDKLGGKSILDTRIYMKDMCWKNIPESHESFVTCFCLLSVNIYFLKQGITSLSLHIVTGI